MCGADTGMYVKIYRHFLLGAHFHCSLSILQMKNTFKIVCINEKNSLLFEIDTSYYVIFFCYSVFTHRNVHLDCRDIHETT